MAASFALGVLILVGGAGLVVAIAARFRVPMRSDEAIALGAVGIIMVGCAGYPAARLTDSGVTLDAIGWAMLAVALAGLLAAGAVAFRRRPSARSAVAWALPGLLVAAAGVGATLIVGYEVPFASNIHSDPTFRADAMKDLVWANEGDAVTGRVPLSEDNRKYPGYLAARGGIAKLAGEDPWLLPAAFALLCAAAMAAATFALARNVGLRPWAAAVAAAAVPLLGGDAYILDATAQPRHVAMLVLIAGLALVARGVGLEGRRRLVVAGIGGVVVGLAAVLHVLYLLIAASIIAPIALVAVLFKRWLGDIWKPVAVAFVAGVASLCLSIPHARTFEASSLAEASSERTEENVSGRNLIESGDSVFPPRIVNLDQAEILYSNSSLYSLSPGELATLRWGERTSPLIALAGLVAALLLAGRATRLLIALLASVVALPLLLQFNPLVFPQFVKYFSSYRAEYISFEFGWLAVAATVAAAAANWRRGAIVAIVAVASAVYLADVTMDAHDARFQDPDVPPGVPELFERLQDVRNHTQNADPVYTTPRIWFYAAAVLPQRKVFYRARRTPAPNPFSAREDPDRVRRNLEFLSDRIVVVVDDTLPRNAAINRLLRSGDAQLGVAAPPVKGIFVVRVPTPPKHS